MKNITLFTLLFAVGFTCFAQKVSIIEIKNVNINDGKNIIEALPPDTIYIFPEFTQGKIFFKNGIIDSAKFNYNTLLSEMQFLDKNKNILSVLNPQDVSRVIIDNRVFHYISEKSFAELLVTFKDVNFFKKCRIEYTYTQDKTAAYGQSSSTTAVVNYKNIYANGDEKKLAVYRDIKFKIIDDFFFETDGKFNKANSKKTFIKVFPQCKDEINKYVSAKKVNFKNEQDLIKLTNYCIQIITTKNE
ncbi:MAG: hypothetical protein LBT56_08605 [Prevotellaceae bacterium]|jgi:hypothetical protein|nr:hypothetical protein [Prevotellaceae bacterium]